MRFAKITANGKTTWGLVEGDRVTEISGEPFGEWHEDVGQARPEGRQDRAAADPAHLLLRRPQLRQARAGGRQPPRRGAEHSRTAPRSAIARRTR